VRGVYIEEFSDPSPLPNASFPKERALASDEVKTRKSSRFTPSFFSPFLPPLWRGRWQLKCCAGAWHPFASRSAVLAGRLRVRGSFPLPAAAHLFFSCLFSGHQGDSMEILCALYRFLLFATLASAFPLRRSRKTNVAPDRCPLFSFFLRERALGYVEGQPLVPCFPRGRIFFSPTRGRLVSIKVSSLFFFFSKHAKTMIPVVMFRLFGDPGSFPARWET